MKFRIKTIIGTFLLFSVYLCIAVEVPLPSSVVLGKLPSDMKNSWAQVGTVPLTFTAAVRNFEHTLQKQGWRQLQAFYYDNRQKKKFEVWAKGNTQVLFHFWRDLPDRTGFSWGEVDKSFIEKHKNSRKVNKAEK